MLGPDFTYDKKVEGAQTVEKNRLFSVLSGAAIPFMESMLGTEFARGHKIGYWVGCLVKEEPTCDK